MNEEKLEPLHPGEVLLEEFLKPMGLSQTRLALDIRVPPRRINEIVHGSGRIYDLGEGIESGKKVSKRPFTQLNRK